jgi:hypothetical protein
MPVLIDVIPFDIRTLKNLLGLCLLKAYLTF